LNGPLFKPLHWLRNCGHNGEETVLKKIQHFHFLLHKFPLTQEIIPTHTQESKNSYNWLKQSGLMLIRFLSIIYTELTGLSLYFLGFFHLESRTTPPTYIVRRFYPMKSYEAIFDPPTYPTIGRSTKREIKQTKSRYLMKKSLWKSLLLFGKYWWIHHLCLFFNFLFKSRRRFFLRYVVITGWHLLLLRHWYFFVVFRFSFCNDRFFRWVVLGLPTCGE
jgi:hypothetical protein